VTRCPRLRVGAELLALATRRREPRVQRLAPQPSRIVIVAERHSCTPERRGS
jgi:hypothetical protein